MKSNMPAFPARLPADVRLDALAPPPADPADMPVIDFTPVPRKRNRRSGWTEARQRAFIAALALSGNVRAAAAEVGLSARTAYRLLDLEGSQSFGDAWSQAIDIGRERVRAEALERALNGSFVPVYRRGRLVRVEYRRNDRLAVALLGGRDQERLHWLGAAARARRSEEKHRAEREKAEREAAYQAELEAMIERGNAIRREQNQPRIRTL